MTSSPDGSGRDVGVARRARRTGAGSGRAGRRRCAGRAPSPSALAVFSPTSVAQRRVHVAGHSLDPDQQRDSAAGRRRSACDLDERPGRGDVRGQPRRPAPSGASAPSTQGDQLAAAGEHPVEQLAGDRRQVARRSGSPRRSTSAEHVARLARPGHGQRLPAGERAPRRTGRRRPPRPSRSRRRRTAGPGRARRARPAPAPASGSAPRRPRRRRPGPRAAAPSRPRTVSSARPGSTTGGTGARSASTAVQHRVRRSPSATQHALGREQLGQRRAPAATTTTAVPLPRRAGSALVGEPGHRDPVRPAGLDAGLDRAADVVDVHVHVPGALAGADTRPASRRARPARPAGRRPSSGGVEQVLHLVAVLRRSRSRGPPVAAGVRSRARLGTRRPGSAGDHLDQRVQQQAQAAAAGVDHAGPGQHRQLLGGAGQRGARRQPPPGPPPQVTASARPRPAAAARGHATAACPRPARPPPRRRPRPPRERAGQRPPHGGLGGERVGDAAQDLRDDHAGVAAGAEQRAAGHAAAAPAVRGGRRRAGPVVASRARLSRGAG